MGFSQMKSKSIKNSHVVMHELVLPNDTNVLGNVHGGRVMCLMDICAAMSAYKHAPEMRKLNKLWAMMTNKMMTDGLTEENTHPGAIRAYKELGIWDTRKGTVPVTYPGS